jgi:hypothetical protein
VEPGVNVVSFDITFKEATTIATGNRNVVLTSDDQTITVIATAETGRTRTLNFHVTRGVDVTGVELAELSANIVVTDTYQIQASVLPAKASQAVTYTSADPSIATVDENGLVTGVKAGTTTIRVASVADPGVNSDFTIGVIGNRIMSNDLDVFHEDTDDVEFNYVIGGEPLVKAADYRTLFINEPEYLHFFNGDKDGEIGEEITDLDNTNVGSFMYLKLIIDGREYDSATIIVRGDVNGDGRVVTADVTIVQQVIGRKIESTPRLVLAADVDKNTRIMTADASQISQYIARKRSSLNN